MSYQAQDPRIRSSHEPLDSRSQHNRYQPERGSGATLAIVLIVLAIVGAAVLFLLGSGGGGGGTPVSGEEAPLITPAENATPATNAAPETDTAPVGDAEPAQ